MSAGAISHDFLAIDEGRATLLHIDEREPARNWLVPIGRPEARDLQLVGNGRVLVGHAHGYTEFDIEQGRVAKTFNALRGVTSVRRQPDGRTLVAGVDMAGSQGVVVLELDAGDRELRRTVFGGDYVRLIRQTHHGSYLMCCNDRIREVRADGTWLRDFTVAGFEHAWKAVPLPDGGLMVTAGYGACVVELAADGCVRRSFGSLRQVPTAVRPFFYASFQLLPNGHVVLANWQGHGLGRGESGRQLLEFDRHGEIVWSWSRAELISSLQAVLVLDGLDLSRLHDERDGTMAPLA